MRTRLTRQNHTGPGVGRRFTRRAGLFSMQPDCRVMASGSAWWSTRFGTEGSEVQILSPRPTFPENIGKLDRSWSAVVGHDQVVFGSSPYADLMLSGSRPR